MPAQYNQPGIYQNSVERTYHWLVRCKNEMARLNGLPDTINPHQMLFGINQGGIYEDIRIENAKEVAKLDLDGYAVGGLAVGESHEEMYRIPGCSSASSSSRKTGLSDGCWNTGQYFRKLCGSWRAFFDCVLYPSRNGRHGHVYTKYGKLNLFNAKV